VFAAIEIRESRWGIASVSLVGRPVAATLAETLEARARHQERT
jgi:hypothetical protein